MSGRFLVPWVAGAVALIMASSVSAEEWAFVGVGQSGCAEWLQTSQWHLGKLDEEATGERPYPEQARDLTRWHLTLTDQWIYGFVSGAQQRYSTDNRIRLAAATAKFAAGDYVTWVHRWCELHLDKTVGDGAAALSELLVTNADPTAR